MTIKKLTASALLAILGYFVNAPVPASAETTCVRDEQHGCLTIEVVGVAYNEQLMQKIEGMSAADQAKSLGMDVYDKMSRGIYRAAGEQHYVLYLWMKPEWGNKPLPGARISQVCYNGTSGNTIYQARGLTNLTSLPKVVDPLQPNLGIPQFALPADCNGRGGGWIIPYDVMQQVALVIICPHSSTYYPFRQNGRQEAIVHTGAEIAWYLQRNWDYVLSAAVWPTK